MYAKVCSVYAVPLVRPHLSTCQEEEDGDREAKRSPGAAATTQEDAQSDGEGGTMGDVHALAGAGADRELSFPDDGGAARGPLLAAGGRAHLLVVVGQRGGVSESEPSVEALFRIHRVRWHGKRRHGRRCAH